MTSTTYRWHSCSKDDFPFKRHKVPKACQLCRQKKIRCDGQLPCGRCNQHGLECTYGEQRQQRSGQTKDKDDVSNSDNGSHSSKETSSAAYDDSDDNRPARQTQPARAATASVPPLSPSPQPSPHHHEYSRSSLKRISFANDLYESMRHHDSSTTTKSYLLGTQLPPLLFDFFNLTSQPYKIWSSFIAQFRLFLTNNTRDSTTAPLESLSKEIIHLFAKFNLLYSTMFNCAPLHSASVPALSQAFCHQNSPTSIPTPTSPVGNTIDIITVFAIHAIVLHAAFQSLATTCKDIASGLEDYADFFYQKARSRFLDATFIVDKNRSFDRASLLQLARVAVLLAHYQCAAVCEEQAYMTLRIGIGYALRCNLHDIVHGAADPSISSGEKKRLKTLYRVLNAWQVWFSFYLHREEWTTDNTVALPSPNDRLFPSTLPKTSDATDTKAARQRWAMDVTDGYTSFLKRLSRSDMKCSDIKQHLESLQAWSKIHAYDARKAKNQQQKVKQEDFSRPSHSSLPACILALYHHTLTIQVFFCQIPASLRLFSPKTTFKSPKLEADEKPSNASSRDMILDLCDSAAADIVHIIDDLTMDHHTLLSETDALRHHDPIVHAVLYPLCLAASVSVSCLRQRKPYRGSNISPKQEEQQIQATEIAAAAAVNVAVNTETKAATVMPIYKLQRLLNPICSQMEVANVITSPLDEIQATAKPLSSSPSKLITQTLAEGRLIPVPSAAAATNPHLQRLSAKPRFVDSQWMESFTEESMLSDTLSLQGSGGTVRPLTRNDIDREQLEKLSRKKDLRGNNSSSVSNNASSIQAASTMAFGGNMDMFNKAHVPFNEAAAAASTNAPGLSLRHTIAGSSDAHSNLPLRASAAARKRRNTTTVQQQQQQQQTILAHSQKRQYTATSYPNLGIDYQQHQVPVLTSKRIRTDPAYSDDAMRQMEMLRTDHRNQRLSTTIPATTNGTYNNLNMHEIPDQSDLSMYTDELFFIGLTDPAEVAATTTTSDPSLYASRVGDRTMRTEAPPTPEPFTSSMLNSTPATTNSGGGIVNSLASNASKVPLLPAPNQRTQPPKNWTTTANRQKNWNLDFQASIVETLHQNTHMSVDSTSFGTGIADPSMNLNIDPMTSHATQQPNMNDNSNLMFFFNMESQQQRLAQPGWIEQHPQFSKSRRKSGNNKMQQQQSQQQKRSKTSPRSWSQQPPVLEPTNSSATTSDGRSTSSASPGMFTQDPWLDVPQNKMATDSVLTSWN